MTNETKQLELHDYLNCHQFVLPLVSGSTHALACQCGCVKFGDTVGEELGLIHIEVKEYKELINNVGPEVLERIKRRYRFKIEGGMHYHANIVTAQMNILPNAMSYKELEDYGSMKAAL